MSTPSPKSKETGLHLSILTPEDVLYEGDVDWIQVPLQDGLVGIWPGHAPLIGALAPGNVSLCHDEKTTVFPVTDGVLRVGVERCAILLSRNVAQNADANNQDAAASLVDAIDHDLGTEVVEALSDEPTSQETRSPDATELSQNRDTAS